MGIDIALRGRSILVRKYQFETLILFPEDLVLFLPDARHDVIATPERVETRIICHFNSISFIFFGTRLNIYCHPDYPRKAITLLPKAWRDDMQLCATTIRHHTTFLCTNRLDPAKLASAATNIAGFVATPGPNPTYEIALDNYVSRDDQDLVRDAPRGDSLRPFLTMGSNGMGSYVGRPCGPRAWEDLENAYERLLSGLEVSPTEPLPLRDGGQLAVELDQAEWERWVKQTAVSRTRCKAWTPTPYTYTPSAIDRHGKHATIKPRKADFFKPVAEQTLTIMAPRFRTYQFYKRWLAQFEAGRAPSLDLTHLEKGVQDLALDDWVRLDG